MASVPVITLMIAALCPSTVSKYLRQVPTQPPFFAVKLQQAITQISGLRHAVIPAAEQTTEQQFSVLTLNVQISVRSKTRALAQAIAQTDYPDVVFLHERGKVPQNFVFHPLYLAISTQVV